MLIVAMARPTGAKPATALPCRVLVHTKRRCSATTGRMTVFVLKLSPGLASPATTASTSQHMITHRRPRPYPTQTRTTPSHPEPAVTVLVSIVDPGRSCPAVPDRTFVAMFPLFSTCNIHHHLLPHPHRTRRIHIRHPEVIGPPPSISTVFVLKLSPGFASPATTASTSQHMITHRRPRSYPTQTRTTPCHVPSHRHRAGLNRHTCRSCPATPDRTSWQCCPCSPPPHPPPPAPPPRPDSAQSPWPP